MSALKMPALADPEAQTPSYEGEDVFVAVPADFRLETGDTLPDAHVRLRRYGRADGPVVVVSGGISSGRFVAGEGGWWTDHIGPGMAIDLDNFCVFGFDFAPVEDHRVRLSPRDQARLIATSLDALGIGVIEAWIGSSYGGSVGLSFAAHAPACVKISAYSAPRTSRPRSRAVGVACSGAWWNSRSRTATSTRAWRWRANSP
ncbi:MAG: hypothetical protein M0D54_00750 [Hyphomonadaceae bacterium JAD_PAG50586_4]|nr:MAG: hypothetical protein M0D54_00750 [Hyphomonadaceae bacterium JAD_PAG50586_4]